VEAFTHEPGDALVRVSDERTSRFQEAMSATLDFGQPALRGAVGGNQDGGSSDRLQLALQLDAGLTELRQNAFIMDEVTEDRERTVSRFAMGEGDGITDAEAHAEMRGA
jgi:hypothetical protein